MIIREASGDDVPAMARCRLGDPGVHPADPRMAAYLAGEHHPQQALPPRVAYVAEADGEVVGYIAGHATRRFDCDGEVQYLYVSPSWRRRGVGAQLLARLATWFVAKDCRRVCVNVDLESPSAAPFYRKFGASPLGPHWYVWDDVGVVGAAGAP